MSGIREGKSLAAAMRNAMRAVWQVAAAAIKGVMNGQPVRLGLLSVLGLLLAACTTVPEPSSSPASPLQLSAQRLTDVVLIQGLRQRAAGPRTVAAAPSVAVLPVTVGKARAGTAVETQLLQWVAEQVRQQSPAAAVLPVPTEDATRAAWQLQPSLAAADSDAPHNLSEAFVLRLDLIETATGQILFSASERVVDPGLAELSRALKSSVAVAPAKPAAVVAAPTPAETLQALSAEYVALLKAGHEQEAQRVFARWIETSLQSRSLNMKLLFAPSSRNFWPDPVLIRRYDLWLAELARQLQNSPHCLQVVGHTSRSGREDANRRLSLQRAGVVRQILLKHQPGLEPRLSAVGVGWEQASPASMAEDGRAAADQRVDFRVVDCP